MLAPTGAAGAAPWSEPTTVTRDGVAGLAFTSSGRGLLSWGDARGLRGRVVLPSGRLGRPYTISPRGFRLQSPPLAIGRDRVLLLGRPEGFGGRLGVAEARLGRRRGRAVRIEDVSERVVVDSVAAGEPGRVAIALTGEGQRLQLATRDRAGRFRIRTVARGVGPGKAVAINRVGDVLLAWTKGAAVHARRFPRGGRAARAERVATLGPFFQRSLWGGNIGAGLASSGLAAVAWWRPTEVGDGFGARQQLFASVARPRRRFGPRQELEPPMGAGVAPIEVVATGRSRLLIGWNGDTAGYPLVDPVHVADVTARGLGLVQEAAPAVEYPTTQVLDRIAVGRRGEVAIAMADPNQRERLAVALRRRAGEAFLPTEEILPPAADRAREPVSVAIHPASGRPVVAWEQYTTPCRGRCRFSTFLSWGDRLR